jgi:predicted PurR-regulated permease PerM
MALDLAVIGVVFAIILLIIFFSAVVLYLSFRIKETFRKEKRKGATVAKVAFLIGILFLAGGLFYFFANTFTNITQPTPNTTPTPTPSPGVTPTPTPTDIPLLTLSVSAPSEARMSSELGITFTINNPTSLVAHGVYLETNGLLSDFSLVSSTHEVVGSVVNIGEVPSGITIVSIDVIAYSRPQTSSNTVTLNYQEMTNPITETIMISIKGN